MIVSVTILFDLNIGIYIAVGHYVSKEDSKWPDLIYAQVCRIFHR